MQQAPKFQEEYSAKFPALALLTNLGWQFYSSGQALDVSYVKFQSKRNSNPTYLI